MAYEEWVAKNEVPKVKSEDLGCGMEMEMTMAPFRTKEDIPIFCLSQMKRFQMMFSMFYMMDAMLTKYKGF